LPPSAVLARVFGRHNVNQLTTPGLRTVPRRNRADPAPAMRYRFDRSDLRTPSTAVPAILLAFAVGAAFLFGAAPNSVLILACLWNSKLLARKHVVRPGYRRAAAVAPDDARLRMRGHDLEVVGRRRSLPVRIQVGADDLIRTWTRACHEARHQGAEELNSIVVRQPVARNMLVKAALERTLAILLDHEADIGRLKVGTQFEIAMHAMPPTRSIRMRRNRNPDIAAAKYRTGVMTF
jgi:hypothetical protein